MISVFHFYFFFTVGAEASIGWYDYSDPAFHFLLDSYAGSYARRECCTVLQEVVILLLQLYTVEKVNAGSFT